MVIMASGITHGRDSVVVVVVVVVVVAVVRTRPRAIPLAMITMRKSTHGFLFLSYMGMGLRLVDPQAAGALLKTIFTLSRKLSTTCIYCLNENFFTVCY